MRPIQRILCCTDLSENSTPAVHAAVKLAELHNADLTVMYVVAQADALQAPLVEEVRKKIQQRAQQEIAKICPPEDDTPVRARAEIRHGNVREVLLRAARELGIDLIVAGTHGHTGNLKAGPGHIAETLVRKGPCNVVLVHPEHEDDFERIAVAGDFSAHSKLAFERAVDLAKRVEVKKLSLFHVCHLPEEYWLTGRSEEDATKRMVGFAEKHAEEFMAGVNSRGVAVDLVIEEGRKATTIASLARKKKIDLLVLGSHGRTVGGAALLGSVAERILRDCPTSMWVEIDPKQRIGVLQALGHIMGLTE